MKDCIFCKIVAGEISASKVYENENFVAFLEIMPVTKGHILIIPKQHFATIYDVPEDISAAYLPVVQKLNKAITKAFKPRKVVLAVWGEDVAHAHIHLIPRYEGDGLEFFKQKKVAPDKLVLNAEKIIKALG